MKWPRQPPLGCGPKGALSGRRHRYGNPVLTVKKWRLVKASLSLSRRGSYLILCDLAVLTYFATGAAFGAVVELAAGVPVLRFL